MQNFIKGTFKLLFGEIDTKVTFDIALILAFFVCLFSATCFFFNHHEIVLWGQVVQFPVGLLFFPTTFVISNIIQDRNGREYANTVVAGCFLADLALVCMTWVIAHVGDRADYYTVFKDLPLIMGATFFFLGVSSITNSYVYERMNSLRQQSLSGLFMSFFISITLAELAVSSMSMPMLFKKEGLSGNVILTVLLAVSYKIIFNLIATAIYTVVEALKNQNSASRAIV